MSLLTPRFDIWIPAVEAGYLPLAELVAWADSQIRALDHPPYWLLELAHAEDAAQVRAAFTHVSETNVSQNHSRDTPDLYLGFLYLGFQAGRISMEDMLRQAGDYADGRGYDGSAVPDCEEFYLLLNEIDGGGPVKPTDHRPLPQRVADVFRPFAQSAQFVLKEAPFEPV
jgi:hypothetical protein